MNTLGLSQDSWSRRKCWLCCCSLPFCPVVVALTWYVRDPGSNSCSGIDPKRISLIYQKNPDVVCPEPFFFLDLLDQSLNQKMNDLPSSTPVSESKPMGSFYLSKAYRIFYIAIHPGSRAHREEGEQEGTQKYNSHDALWSHRQAQTVPFNQKEPVIILYLAMELSTEINLFLRKIWIETNSSVW